MDRDEHGQIDGRLLDAHAADGVHENVVAARFDAAVTMENGQEQRQPLRIEPDRETARQHLVSLFTVAGPDDPAVVAARRQLASALF